MKSFWVNFFTYGRSVADVEAHSEAEALDVALRETPPDSDGQFQGHYREIYERSPCFVTEEKPRLLRETSPLALAISYPARRHQAERMFHVRQNYTWLESVLVEAEEPDEAARLYSEACSPTSDRSLLEDTTAEIAYMGPILVTLQSQAITSEEQFFGGSKSGHIH